MTSIFGSMSSPLVSVVMPIYNADDYLEESVGSILNQTYKNFELIIVSDNSTQRTYDILNRFQQKDERLLVIHQKKEGVIKARNKCCKMASGKYVAIMDGDDISYPERLKTQVDYLEGHPEIGIVGSWYHIIDSLGSVTGCRYPPTDPEIVRVSLLFGNSVGNSSVMIRNDLLKTLHYYREDRENFCEDYDLWIRALEFSHIANIDEFLVGYRIQGKNISASNSEDLERNAVELKKSFINSIIKRDVDIEQIKLMDSFASIRNPEISKKICCLILELSRIMASENHTKKDRINIQGFMSIKLFYLGFCTLKMSVNGGLNIIFVALKTDKLLLLHSLFYLKNMIKAKIVL